MLTIDQISEYFTADMRGKNPQGVLVEYLQHELLDSIFKEKSASALCFIGGTAIRILYQNPRFSEDMDFDNFGLSFKAFENLLGMACKDMTNKGFAAEYRLVGRGAYNCCIKFPDILSQTGISPQSSRKILICIDAEANKKYYKPQPYILNRFALYRQIWTAPASVLLAQKMMTVMERKREKGRDLFDVSYLMGLAEPDFSYIAKCMNCDKKQFLKLFDAKLKELDLNFLAKDVESFLSSPEHKERILTFRDYWKTKNI
ncbi:MAG: nucleotidyl transferase AbiEii/AbiGii toxin family protein [Syntrophaceae bacterium]|nr:nucleotidyl transferase AbiEii/AbiGii toxin family protein [Syntrophaceae bacterium]